MSLWPARKNSNDTWTDGDTFCGVIVSGFILSGLGNVVAAVIGEPLATPVAIAVSIILTAAICTVIAAAASESRSVGVVKLAGYFFLGWALLLSVAVLTAIHLVGEPPWMKHIEATPNADGILWQVQTTFLSVGFAGLAIAAQLFAESPLAIGASRGRVLEYAGAGWFVGVGLVANAVIAIETIWLPSDFGALLVTGFWALPTVVMLVVSYGRLMRLFGNPSLLDEVVRLSLVESFAGRLGVVARTYAEARRQLDGLFTEGPSGDLGPSAVSFRVPVPRPGLVIKAIKPHVVRRAIASLAPAATDGTASDNQSDELGELYQPPQIRLTVEPGDRTRLGDTAFRVSTSQKLDQSSERRLVQLLQTSIEFEPPGSVTPDEETDREIANLKDTIGTSLRSGAYGTAERALELLGHVVRGVWMARPETLNSSPRSSSTRRDWLYRSVGEAEQDALLDPRAAGLFASQAMTRALEAPQVGSTDYVDECLRSFARLWFDILRYGGDEFASLHGRITTCVQNLAAYGFSNADGREDLQARATWAMVELVKLAIDAKRLPAAIRAAEELDGLFEYSKRGENGRAHVRAGQLVLSGWLDYLDDKGDERRVADPGLRMLVTPRGDWSEILGARHLAERGVVPFSRWDWWEVKDSGSVRAQTLELSHYIDRAEVMALASSYGQLPPADDQETASAYERFVRLLEDGDHQLSTAESNLKRELAEAVARWDEAENERLAQEPLSPEKINALRAAVVETLATNPRLAAEIPVIHNVANQADASRPILGMNFRVPRHYLVDEVFSQTYADSKELGQVIARGFVDGEDRKIIEVLRNLQPVALGPSAEVIRKQIEALGEEVQNYVLVTPYGGLLDSGWYSREFRQSLALVTQIETGALDQEAILFDRRSTLVSYRRPEDKEGLLPVGDTSIALGVFEDVQGTQEPQVRIETGEHFVVWADQAPRLVRFAAPESADRSTV